MRIRNAAIAGATAIAVAFGGASIASAETTEQADRSSQIQQSSQDIFNSSKPTEASTAPAAPAEGEEGDEPKPADGQGTNLSSKFGGYFKKDEVVDGRALFGSNKDGFSSQAPWAQAFYALTVIASLASFVGLIAGPLDNFLKYGIK